MALWLCCILDSPCAFTTVPGQFRAHREQPSTSQTDPVALGTPLQAILCEHGTLGMRWCIQHLVSKTASKLLIQILRSEPGPQRFGCMGTADHGAPLLWPEPQHDSCVLHCSLVLAERLQTTLTPLHPTMGRGSMPGSGVGVPPANGV